DRRSFADDRRARDARQERGGGERAHRRRAKDVARVTGLRSRVHSSSSSSTSSSRTSIEGASERFGRGGRSDSTSSASSVMSSTPPPLPFGIGGGATPFLSRTLSFGFSDSNVSVGVALAR